MNNKEVAASVPKGERLPTGECPPEIFEILTKCWRSNPDERPNFETLLSDFEKVANFRYPGNLS